MSNTALTYHVSVDDVFDGLIEVSDQGMPLRDHSTFRFLAELHEGTAAAIDLYLFAEGRVRARRRTLRDVQARLADELGALPWLRYGPHALRDDVPPYQQTVDEQRETFEWILDELRRFASGSPLSSWLRLHYFSECYELAPWLLERGFRTLLLTDKDAVAYRLPSAERAELARSGCVEFKGLELRRSDVRIERWLEMNLTAADWRQRLDALLDRNGCAVLFTHEVELRRPDVRRALKESVQYLSDRGATSR